MKQPTEVLEDPGVQSCTAMHEYYKAHDHSTICMPASWRPSRGPTEDGRYDLDEILALAGADRMTIPAPLLAKLAASEEPVTRVLFDEPKEIPLEGNGSMTEAEFRLRSTLDGCINDKLAEGLRAFIGETEKLQAAIQEKVTKAAVSS